MRAPSETSEAGARAHAQCAASPFRSLALTPITGLGFDRNKVPAMVQTVVPGDFSRVYSPNVVETLKSAFPGVITNDVQGNEFTTDLRYRGFSASLCRARRRAFAVKACASTRPSATPSTGT